MRECLGFAAAFLIGGILAVLSSVTRTGRNLDRAYLNSLPRWLRIKTLEPLRNPIAALVGAAFVIIGIAILAKAIRSWWIGVPCG